MQTLKTIVLFIGMITGAVVVTIIPGFFIHVIGMSFHWSFFNWIINDRLWFFIYTFFFGAIGMIWTFYIYGSYSEKINRFFSSKKSGSGNSKVSQSNP